jgi:opacity protein-like surface antigen
LRFSRGTRFAAIVVASPAGDRSMRRVLCILTAVLCVSVTTASAQVPRAAVEGFGGLQLGSVGTIDTAFGGLVTGALTPNLQVVGEAGRLSNILPPLTDTLIAFSPLGVSVSAWYMQGGLRFTTAATSGIRPYAETSAGFAHMHTSVGGLGGEVGALTNLGLGFLDRTDPMATAGAGVTFEHGNFVADIGYRYRRIFSSDWVNTLALGDTLHTNEVRVGVGVRF